MPDDRNVKSNFVSITINGEELPTPLEIEGVGNLVVYQRNSVSDLGGIVDQGANTVRIVFPVTKSKTLREIANDPVKLIADHIVVLRFHTTDRAKPMTTTDLNNFRITSFSQGYDPQYRAPVEVLEGFPQIVTSSN